MNDGCAHFFVVEVEFCDDCFAFVKIPEQGKVDCAAACRLSVAGDLYEYFSFVEA